MSRLAGEGRRRTVTTSTALRTAAATAAATAAPSPTVATLAAFVTYLPYLIWFAVLGVVQSAQNPVTEPPECPDSFFLCQNGACVNVSLICDGENDCGDSSDEDTRLPQCATVLSAGLIAAIAVGSIVGAILLCCWIGSVIECIQHMYKYWCQCCHSADMSDVTFTTVIPNMAADPSTVGVAGSLPPSYSSIFRNDAAFAAEVTPLAANSNNTANALVPSCPPRPASYQTPPCSYQRSETFQCAPSYQRGNLPSSYQSCAYPYPVPRPYMGTPRLLSSEVRTDRAEVRTDRYMSAPMATHSIAVQVPDCPSYFAHDKPPVMWC